MSDPTNATATTSVADDIKASLDNLFSTVVKDELGVVRPAADEYLNAIIAQPDINSIVLKSVAFQAQAVGLLPNLESAAAKDTAASLKALIDLEADKLLGVAPGTVASTATSAAVAPKP